MNTLFCPWPAPQYLIFSENIPPFLFYSHIPAMLIALGIGLFVYFKDRKSATGSLLLVITLLFSAWTFFDLLLWATNNPSDVMFYWSFQILTEGLIVPLSIYFSYLFMFKKEMRIPSRILLFLLALPPVVFLSSKSMLIGVNISDCTAIEGPLALYYSYFLEIIGIITITAMYVRAQRKFENKLELRTFAFGIIFFLIAFSWGNIIGSFTDNWTLAQAGLIGMPIFVGFLAYTIVKFNAFNIRILGAQVLVYALGFLVLSLLFVRTIGNVRILTVFTLVLIFVLGRALVKGVKVEIKQRERMELLTTELEYANEKLQGLDKLETEFLSLASHQLRSPLTAIRGYTSMLLDGSFGKVTDQQKEAIDRVFQSSVHLAKVVEDLLNVSKIEQGGMKYEMAPFDFEKVAKDLSTDLSITAQKKGLVLTFQTDNKAPYSVNGDMEKIRQVVLNIIDNSIKYTEKGSITVSLKKDDAAKIIRLDVIDTGMGISAEDKEKLFQKFGRGAGGKTNTGGSGLGLYLAKQIAEAHGGHIAIDSAGVGKGSTFSIELKALG